MIINYLKGDVEKLFSKKKQISVQRYKIYVAGYSLTRNILDFNGSNKISIHTCLTYLIENIKCNWTNWTTNRIEQCAKVEMSIEMQLLNVINDMRVR